jgi:hypothetical protein
VGGHLFDVDAMIISLYLSLFKTTLNFQISSFLLLLFVFTCGNHHHHHHYVLQFGVGPLYMACQPVGERVDYLSLARLLIDRGANINGVVREREHNTYVDLFSSLVIFIVH